MCGIVLVLGRLITEIPPAIDHLLGRAPADAELQTPAGDQIGGACVLDHVERVLVAHVDDGGADLDPAGSWRRPRPATGRARRVGARSDGRGNRRRPRPIPRQQRQGRWIAKAYLRPSASAIAARESSVRTKGSRSFSCGQFNDARADLPPSRGVADPRGSDS